jgi:hypothetical protein
VGSLVHDLVEGGHDWKDMLGNAAISGVVGGVTGGLFSVATQAVGAGVRGLADGGIRGAGQLARTAAREEAADIAGGRITGGLLQSCNSFTPATDVVMADGSRRPIDQVRVGDTVVATDPTTGNTEARAVTEVIIGWGAKNLVEVRVDTDGSAGDRTDTITATDQHPFWVSSLDRWVHAADLKAGYQLETADHRPVTVVATRTWTQEQRVYNLTVDGLHTYYAVAGATPVLVHNCPGLDVLAAAGEKLGKGGFTRAGLELQKHATRPTNVGQWEIPIGKQNPAAWSELGQHTLEDILTHPKTAVRSYVNKAGDNVMEFLLPNRGAQFRQESGVGDWLLHSFREA